MTDSHIIATARDYAQLIAAFRTWIAQLGTHGESIDALAGLPLKYTMKLLAPVPVKSIGRTSLGPLLGALGLKLIVAVDQETLDRIKDRLEQCHSSNKIRPLAKKKKRFVYPIQNSDISRILNARRTLLLSPERRSQIARDAVMERWRKVRQARADSAA